jgi:16S rRNA (cytosine967-C5)-methyltransferase
MIEAAIDAANARAIAAQALQRIAEGHSLRAEFASSSTKLRDSRDRAMLSALLHDGARWWLRYDAALDRLLDRPLRKREPKLHALLVLGLIQLDVLRLPEYAAVAATVDAVRAIGKPQFSGLANAVLRAGCASAPRSAPRSMPIRRRARRIRPGCSPQSLADWPDAAAARSSRRTTPKRRCGCASIAGAPAARHCCKQFVAAGVEAQAPELLADALLIARSRDVTALPGYETGLFSVQDGAAQFTADLLEPSRRVSASLDACAAPGGRKRADPRARRCRPAGGSTAMRSGCRG